MTEQKTDAAHRNTVEQLVGETLRECCGQPPTVFEMRPGDWAVHCCNCWDGSGPCATRKEAVDEWNAMT